MTDSTQVRAALGGIAAPTPVAEAGTLVRRPGRADVNPRRYRRRRRSLEIGLAVAVPMMLLLLWEYAGYAGWFDTRFFPRPSTCWTTAIELIRDGKLQEEVWISTKRILIGFTLGVASGFVAGVIMGMFRLVKAAFEPTLNALYTVPKLALLPALLLIFGTQNDNAKIALITITVFFFMWISTMSAIASVSRHYTEALESFGANSLQTFWHVLLPGSLREVFVAMRLSAGVSVLVIVGIEFVTGSNGIGHLIWNSWQLFLPARTYVGIVTVALMGLVFSAIVQFVGARLTPWEQNTHGVARF